MNRSRPTPPSPTTTSTTASRRDRRGFFLVAGAAIVGIAWAATRRSAVAAGNAPAPSGPVTIVPFTDAGVRQPPVSVSRVVKTDDEWKKQLDAQQFLVTRKAGTERPFTGVTWDNHQKGLYRCICCDTPIYDSETKFESGTGWPSFWQPIAPENVVSTRDTSFMMVRTAVSCARCDAHLGHVFDDGPKPTGLRYCMNSAAMKFVKHA